jgi:hypothetical protein
MKVKAQYCGNRVAGLYVGPNNVRRYFSKRMQQVELQLDHLRILCGLTPLFWQDKPEIHDPRLSVWLEEKRPHGVLGHAEIPLALIPSGKNSFRLAAVSQKASARLKRESIKTAQIQIA